MNDNRYCVIMCGGVGSRFWPFSRNAMPKQFIDFFGIGKSLLQMTVERILPLVKKENILLVTNQQYAPIIRTQLPDIPCANILCEPARRNTAPCVLWAAHHIAARCPEATIMMLPSDHLVLKEDAFAQAMQQGCDFAEQNDALFILGIKPTSAHTGYGYIQGEKGNLDTGAVQRVKSFTEKPNREMAELFVKSGEFFWNSGIFIWRASTIINSFRKYAPEISAVFDAGKGLYGTDAETGFIANAFPSAHNISVDYAIMEKADNVFFKSADLGWSDLGTWRALYDCSSKDADGNVMQSPDVISQGCENTLFAVGGEKLVVASGLKDYIVADNGNALLIYPMNEEQRIRHVVNEVNDRFGSKYT